MAYFNKYIAQLHEQKTKNVTHVIKYMHMCVCMPSIEFDVWEVGDEVSLKSAETF